MVKKDKINEKVVYICEDCRLIYQEEEWAIKCELWCKKYHTCNVEICKHALK